MDALQLSTERVYVGCFLVLVSIGFLLLAWHVARDGDINALIFRCALAVFALFFALQFANVAGFVAHYNVARWEQNPKRTLDLPYLEYLGPDAWPAIVEVASFKGASSDEPHSFTKQARDILRNSATAQERRSIEWLSWQARRECQARWLLEQKTLTKDFTAF